LWNRYSPQNFWWFFVGMGVLSALAMVLYARRAKRWTAENA
jgi:Mg2+ and Co2+ transporter CorA